MAIKLWNSPLSPSCRRVRLLAHELELPLELVSMDFRRGDYDAPEFLQRNPNGQVPVLEDDGFVLWESLAILRWLAQKRPERGLIPTDARERARLDQWLFWWTAHPEPAIRLLLRERMLKPFLGQGGPERAVIEVAEDALAQHLEVLDAHLGGRGFVLERFSLAEVAFVPELEMGLELGVDLRRFPRLRGWLERQRARPGWATA